MARKVKPAKPAQLPKLPFSLRDRGAYIDRPWVALARMGKEYLAAVYYSFSSSLVQIAAVGIHEIDNDHLGRSQFHVDGNEFGFGPTGLAKTHLQWLKNQALRVGATPDAIRYMAETIGLTKKEQDEMAKAAKKTNSKPEKAAKPVGNGGKLGGGKKGNPEALAKAREASEAKRAESANRKLKINVTSKQLGSDDFKLRGGRREKLAKLIDANPKTVGDALAIGEFKGSDKETHKIDMGALRGMEKRGHVTIG